MKTKINTKKATEGPTLKPEPTVAAPLKPKTLDDVLAARAREKKNGR